MLTMIVLIVVEFIYKLKEKKLNEFFKVVIILAGAGIIAVGANFTNLWSTYEYGKVSTRSRSELTSNAEDKTSGLDRSYVTDYSYGKMETFTLLIPNFMGGSSEGALGKGSDTYKILQQNNVPNPEKIIKQLPLYWGPQDFVYGPVYAGAILCFLFVLGLFIVKGNTMVAACSYHTRHYACLGKESDVVHEYFPRLHPGLRQVPCSFHDHSDS